MGRSEGVRALQLSLSELARFVVFNPRECQLQVHELQVPLGEGLPRRNAARVRKRISKSLTCASNAGLNLQQVWAQQWRNGKEGVPDIQDAYKRKRPAGIEGIPRSSAELMGDARA